MLGVSPESPAPRFPLDGGVADWGEYFLRNGKNILGRRHGGQYENPNDKQPDCSEPIQMSAFLSHKLFSYLRLISAVTAKAWAAHDSKGFCF